MFSDYTMLVMLYEMGEMSFRLNGASDFYVKTENEDLQLLFARTSNSKFSRFVHYVKEIYLSARVARACSIIFLYSTNHIDLWACRCRRLLNSSFQR